MLTLNEFASGFMAQYLAWSQNDRKMHPALWVQSIKTFAEFHYKPVKPSPDECIFTCDRCKDAGCSYCTKK